MTSDRSVPVTGAANVRDVGGLRTSNGQAVRPGRLLRADSLSGLTAEDAALLADQIGLRLIVDLRTAEEVAEAGRGPLGDRPIAFENLPLRGAGRARDDMVPDLADEPLVAHYFDYLQYSPQVLVRTVELLADGNVPAIVHCTAGKDRTGVTVAMVLDAIGVEHDEIIADYAATAPNMEPVVARIKASPLFQELGIADAPSWLWHAEAETMASFLRRLYDDHGGAAKWLIEAGVDPATIDALRSALLD